jgi:hypothetical protein
MNFYDFKVIFSDINWISSRWLIYNNGGIVMLNCYWQSHDQIVKLFCNEGKKIVYSSPVMGGR